MGVLNMTSVGSLVVKQLMPNCGKKFVWASFVTTNAADFVTFTGQLNTIEGFRFTSTTNATVLAGTISSNILTLSNGATGTKIWSGFAWGY